MTPDWITTNAGELWLLAAVLLGGAEIVVPGVFLVFLAIAAAATGAAVLALPALPVAAQLGSFAAWSIATVAIGNRWYRRFPVESADPMLNDRAARLIGERVTVSSAIEHGEGRVRVGDGEWSAIGTDVPAGAQVTITGIRDGKLLVAPPPPTG